MNLKGKPLIIIFLFAFIFGLIKFSIDFYFPLLYVELGFDPFQIGLLTAITFVVYLLFSAPVGMLCDRKDLRFLILLSLILFLIFFTGMFFFNEIFIILLLVILFRLGTLISKVSLDNILLKFEHSTGNIALGNFAFFNYLGVMIGMILGGFILSQIFFPGLFSIMAVLVFLLIPLIFFLPKIETSKSELKEYIADFSDKKVLIIAFALFLYALHFGAEHISYTLFLRDNLGLDFFGIGFYMSIAIFFMSLTAVLSGRIIKKSNLILFFGISILISGLGHILMVNDNLIVSLFFRIFHEVGDALQAVAYLILLRELFPKTRIGGNSGFFLLFTTLGAIIGSFAFSYIGFGFGHNLSLIISGILSILSALVVLLFLYKK
ncbi:MAG: MFS transporter [Candidatus ainarchaeum sp.]|nr:MFS transporter [Candidatus ainarchaeum sp.]